MQEKLKHKYGNNNNTRARVKTKRMKPEINCRECGAPTRSHLFEDGTAMCHKCFSRMKEDAERMNPEILPVDESGVRPIKEVIEIPPMVEVPIPHEIKPEVIVTPEVPAKPDEKKLVPANTSNDEIPSSTNISN